MASMDVDEGQLETLTADFEHAQENATIDPAEAIGIYRKIIFSGALPRVPVPGPPLDTHRDRCPSTKPSSSHRVAVVLRPSPQ